MLSIVNDILDISKIDAGKIELEKQPFNVKKTVHEVMDLFSGQASKKGVLLSSRLEESVPEWIMGDVTQFRQILVI